MRPGSNRRAAAWLLGLPLGRSGGEECARRGRLEMISFWLLCWKLLRATAGLRRATAELTDGNQDNRNPGDGNPIDGSPGNSNPDNDNPVNGLPRPTSAPPEPVAMEISSTPPQTETETGMLIGCWSQESEGLSYPEVLATHERITAEREGVTEEDGEEEEEEEKEEKSEEEEDREELDGNSLLLGLEEEQGGGGGERTEEEDGKRGEGEGEAAEDGEVGVALGLPLPSDSPPEEAVGSNPSENPGTAMSGECWGHDRDDLSDCLQAELAIVTSDSDAGEDLWASSTPGDTALQEAAGEAVGNVLWEEERKEREPEEEEERGGLRPSRRPRDEEERGGERGEGGGTEEAEREGVAEDETLEDEGRGDPREEQRKGPLGDVLLRSPSVSSTSSSTDADKKAHADLGVHREPSSENVSSEHVDFLSARQQWKRMEEEVKGKPLPQPGLRSQGSFQGTHSSLYPPARSPRLKHREARQQPPREPPLSSTLSPGSEDSGLDDSSYRSPLDEPESAVEREIRLTLERDERHRRERGMVAQGLTTPRPSSLQTGRSPPRPPACRTPTLSVSPSPSPSSSSSSLPRSAYHEMTANNVIILEPDSAHFASRTRLLSPAGFGDWTGGLDAVPTANVIVVETSNLIIRSASEFCLSSTPVSAETQESTFSSNPFFKLRSLSSQSLVEQEIRMVRQREEEWRRQREEEWRRRREEEWRRGREKERYDTVLVSPGLNDSSSYSECSLPVSEVPDRCVSSPSSPSRTRKMERSSLSCDHKFPPALSSLPRRQNAMAQRWEASLLANQKKE